MRLKDAFGVIRGDVVAFTGAGGKTSAMIGLGYELFEDGWRVLATTTTYLSTEQMQFFPFAMPYSDGARAISEALNTHGFVFLYGEIRDDVVYGPSVAWTQNVLDTIDSDVMLIEADKAEGRPLKAPYSDEPVVPVDATLVVPVASMAALDLPLTDENVYNAQALTDKYGFHPGSPVRGPWIAQAIRDDEFGLRGIPEQARVVGFLNQTPENGYMRMRARIIAKMALKSSRLNSVALGSVRAVNPIAEVQRPVGAVVLAAGLSSRMGQPKVLLPWANKRTIIEHIIEHLIRARIDNIVVVTGHYADEVKRVVKPLGVKVVHNRAYRNGEMLSSLKAGLRSMPDSVSASFIVLGDQPRLQPKVLYMLLKSYAIGEGEIIAPSYQMRRGHPILLSRRYWPEVLALRGDRSMRDVFDVHQDEIHYVNVTTDSVLHDVDTPTDYHQERLRAGLSRIDIKNQKPDAS